ncbi:MAG: hypothetical protein RSG48_01030 [Clostridia bacterium]
MSQNEKMTADTSPVENSNNEITNSTGSSESSLFDLIQSIQTKLNKENDNNPLVETNVDLQDVKATDENIDTNKTIKKDSNNQNFDLSTLTSLLGNLDISSILSTLSSTNTNQNTNKPNGSSGFNLSDIDPSMILKIQQLLSSIRKDDPKKNLLLSLKPLLRKSRQDKIGEYITILTVANTIGLFNKKGSEEDV